MGTGVTEEEREAARLRALCELSILDTEAEPEFDDLVSLAAAICDVPISTISLVDVDRVWFKAAKGVALREVPRSIAFCDHALRHGDMFLVEDARADSRFSDNPLVTGQEPVRFYLGMLLRTPEGCAVGTLCVLDRQPRVLTEQQRNALRILADQVSARLELRTKRREAEALLALNRKTEAESQMVQRRFQSFMDSGPFMSYIKDADGRLVYYNRPMAERFGVSREYMLGKLDAELWPAEIAAVFRAHDISVLQNGTLTVTTERTRNDDGSDTIWQSYKFPVAGDHGETLLGGVSVDVTDQLRKEEELLRVQRELTQVNLLLQNLAATDALTGLASRGVFDERLRTGFREARRKSQPFSLLMLDVDNFKQHNDIHGHQHGDEVLRTLASTLLKELRPNDCFARYGGEEFAILVPGSTAEGAMCLADRLLGAVRATRVDGQSVTVSIGICELTDALPDTASLLSCADQALFAAKKQGKDRAVTWCGNLQVVKAA